MSVMFTEFDEEIDSEIAKMSHGSSVLFAMKDPDSLSTDNLFRRTVQEMFLHCPTLLKCLTSALHKSGSTETMVATIATIYGMLMHSRNTKASAIQRLYSSLAIRYHADKELLSNLNKVHLTLSAESKRNLVKEFGDHMEDKLIRDLSEGKTGKLNGDNLDIRVRTSDIRMNNRDKDYHFFTSSIIDRVKVTTYSVAPPEIGMDIGKVLTSAEEKGTYRNGLKVEHLPGFSWMANVFPKHLEHPFSKEMALRSTMHVLPVSLNNEVAYEGCVRIMDEYVQMINRWFAKAGRGDELEALRVPVGGDQLTRVRLQGAKALRAGTHTTQQRLDQLFPVIVELFHTQQDFLEV
ncbi:PREDICTED: uncharacterized protein LOC106813828 [Priapulus caudatus]|uniref:Uncharacterized protein LOC106813828 n=1 Tax=Priapulus caudatus TaxID=37621 RepID=A0ABM1EMX3_PRICU|nr:PREDICTED: uncharacterized protein LOC106813828 [Priapulus caudatus]